MSGKTKYSVLFIAVIILFQFYKFVNIRITNLDLPKGKVLFTSGMRGNDEIYTMNINGSGLKRLTEYSKFGPTWDTWTSDFSPSFSFNAKKVVYDTDRDDRGPRRKRTYLSGGLIKEQGVPTFREIYLMDNNGLNQRRLTYEQIRSNEPIFSPDGKKILFFSQLLVEKNPLHKQIKIINLDNSNQKILISGTLNSGLVKFSPDSQKLFFVMRGDIYVIDINIGNLTRLTQFNSQNVENPDEIDGLSYIEDYAISPDGQNITLVTRERKCLQFVVYSIKTNGLNIKEIGRINNPSNLLYIAIIEGLIYSSDGKKVALIADFDSHNKFFYIIQDNKLNFVRSLNNLDTEINSFVFTPDNKRVIFITEYPIGLLYDWFVWLKSTFHEFFGSLKYYIFRRLSGVYDNKYICIMDIDGKNYRKITKLPIGSSFGRDFIHWEK